MERWLYNKDLQEVKQTLVDAGFNKAEWEDLGGELGLNKNTLEIIKADKGNINACFTECLSKWLERADQVDDRHGRPTMKSLAAALRKMGKKNEADYISGNSSEGKKPAKRQKTDSPTTKTSAGNKEGGAQASGAGGDEDIDGPDATQDPPQDKKYRKVEFSEDLVQGIEILLLPATDAEEKPVMEYLKESPEGYIETEIDGIVTIYIGNFGKIKVIVSKIAHDKSMQGPVHAAIITTKIMERVKSIKHVVAVGVCFGMDRDKHKLGKVIVSESIYDCVSIRQGVDIKKRAAAYTVKPDTKKKFHFTQYEPQPENIEYTVGPIITTSDLIDNPEYKKNLLELIPEAIAGEMEGAGIMAALDYVPQRVGGIVIKGIGDWADGEKKAAEAEDSKPIAARNAARYVYAALNK